MKSINKTITATAIMSSLLSFAIQAAELPPVGAKGTEGDVTFKGGVADITCKVAINGDDSGDAVVELPDVYVAEFAPFGGDPTGKRLGHTDMVISFTECSGAEAGLKKAQVFFDMTENVEILSRYNVSYYKNLSSTGAAGGVGFILTYGSTEIKPGEPSSVPFIDTVAGASITYTVAYYSISNTMTAGQVTSQATYTLQYQ